MGHTFLQPVIIYTSPIPSPTHSLKRFCPFYEDMPESLTGPSSSGHVTLEFCVSRVSIPSVSLFHQCVHSISVSEISVSIPSVCPSHQCVHPISVSFPSVWQSHQCIHYISVSAFFLCLAGNMCL